MNITDKAFLITALFFTSSNFQLHLVQGQLKVGFYSQTCPNAESIVNSVVKEATRTQPRIPPILLRLHFHDCFVEGCDGSILIDKNDDGTIVERFASGHTGLEGFEQINKAKQELEDQCPGVVSCADIVAMAARDAVSLAGGPFYEVETGRRDGRVSSSLLAADMPEVDESIETLKSKFKNKGLLEKELVLLNGAHTIGTANCVFMSNRLYNFTGKNNLNDSDPEINPDFLPVLKDECPQLGGDFTPRIPLDAATSDKFDDKIMHNIKDGKAVIASDARLYDDIITKQVVDSYVNKSSGHKSVSFTQDFTMAMVKMGRIDVKTGSDGEIRRLCNSIN